MLYLQYNDTLKRLNLSHNNFREEGGVIIAEAIGRTIAKSVI